MGAIADAVLKAGGEAIGVIPKHLMTREIGHKRLTKLHIVRSMHERKALMADLADAFIALPGGFGTLRRILRSPDLEPARPACEALRHHQRARILQSVAADARPRRRRAVSQIAKSSVGASGQHTVGIAGSPEGMAPDACGEMAGPEHAVKQASVSLCTGCGEARLLLAVLPNPRINPLRFPSLVGFCFSFPGLTRRKSACYG